MARSGRTWWGSRFIEALERFTDRGRLSRGHAYASGSRILAYDLDGGQVTATVRGNVNPYFGVTEEPRYKTVVRLAPIPPADWSRAIAHISARAGFVAKLLMNEMPDTIEEAFTGTGLHLLPHDHKDFTTSCSCPDWANPCKHVAGVCYLLASLLDDDPFLLFELRGLTREALRAELAGSPLGAILSEDLAQGEATIDPAASYYAEPVDTDQSPAGLRSFWIGDQRPPRNEAPPGGVSAILVKKGGDTPPFWKKDVSFITVMEDLYTRIRSKNRELR